jgi:hypothetical protein
VSVVKRSSVLPEDGFLRDVDGSDQARRRAAYAAAVIARDVQNYLDAITAKRPLAELGDLEAAFVEVAKAYGDHERMSYADWRQAGVSASVLRRAGIVDRPGRTGQSASA